MGVEFLNSQPTLFASDVRTRRQEKTGKKTVSKTDKASAIKEKEKTAKEQPVPGPGQISSFPELTRSQRWKEEQKMLIDSSRYIKPIEPGNLYSIEEISRQLYLPSDVRSHSESDWLVLIALITVTLLASFRDIFDKYLRQLFFSLFSYTASIKMFHERNYNILHGAYRLEAFFYMVLSLFLFLLLKTFGASFNMNEFILFLICMAVVIFYFFLKKTIYKTVGYVNERREEILEIVFNFSNYNRILGLFLSPLVAIAGFYPLKNPQVLFYCGFILIGIFYFLFLLRGAKILLKNQFSIHYLFLYLCTLEILPLVLIGKLILV